MILNLIRFLIITSSLFNLFIISEAASIPENEAIPSTQRVLQDFSLPLSIQLKSSKIPSGKLRFTASNGAPYLTQKGSDTRFLFEQEQMNDLLAHFVRERIPDRIVHAKGSGAHGTFTCTTDYAKQFTTMDVFSQIGKKTPISARFSTVGGESGSSDQARDPRGFSLKFRTASGIWDLVTLHKI